VPEFLVELYVPQAGAAAVEQGDERARLAAEQLTREGTPVRYLRSIFVPEDETCFLLYEAGRAEDVEEAARRASLRVERAAAAVGASRREEQS
jgi:Nickel responsive protein SCO4226-like